MSDETKPFAVVVPSVGQTGWSHLLIGGTFIEDAWNDAPASVDRLRQLAQLVNAAVAARELALREALRVLFDACSDLASVGTRHGKTRINDALRGAIPALAGTGPDYVPAEQLAAEQAKVKALQAALDTLDARETMTAQMVAAYLEAAGLKKPQKPEEWSDEEMKRRLDEVSVEWGRRGWRHTSSVERHRRPDGEWCAYLAREFCDKCGTRISARLHPIHRGGYTGGDE